MTPSRRYIILTKKCPMKQNKSKSSCSKKGANQQSHTEVSMWNEHQNNHRIINLNNADMLFIRLNIY